MMPGPINIKLRVYLRINKLNIFKIYKKEHPLKFLKFNAERRLSNIGKTILNLTKDFEIRDGTIHNIRALTASTGSCVCSSVGGPSSAEEHSFRKNRRRSEKE